MGWIISKALYESWPCSQEQVEESLEDTCLDGEQSVQSSGNPTQLAYLPPDKMTAFSRLSRYGMTFKPLTADRGEDLLMWYREDFLAKTFPQQERERVLKEVDQECGSTWHESSMRYDLDSHSWRTHQCLWDEALQWSLVTLPKWGMTVSGVLFQHPTAERPISVTGSGLWATPTTMDKLPPKSEAALHREATVARPGRSKPANLRDQVSNMRNWPTPTCNMTSGGPNHNSPQVLAGNHGINLAGAVQKWPTPTAHNAKETNAPSEALRNEPTLASRVGGSLNPTWVEALMGWPRNWTQLQPLTLEPDDAFAQDIFGQAMQSMRGDVQQEADAERQDGGCGDLPAPEVLRTFMRKQPQRGDSQRIALEGQKAQEGSMRGVRVRSEIACASLRPESGEQQPGQSPDALQSLPRLLAHHGQAAWKDGSWEDALPRVANGTLARTDRLKAIGNGQVPIVAATAFKILTEAR